MDKTNFDKSAPVTNPLLKKRETKQLEPKIQGFIQDAMTASGCFEVVKSSKDDGSAIIRLG